MRYLLCIFVLWVLPIYVYADVRITEVAWMGTSSSQYSEWIELYNDSDSPVNLSGWKLYKDGDTLLFTLSKSIGPESYLLVERTTASAPDAVPGVNDEAGSFGGGGLSNTGDDISLKDNAGAVVDSLEYASGWPAGDSTTKHTMQWDGSIWVTAASTPKASIVVLDSESSGGTLSDTKIDKVDPYPIPKISPNKPHVEFTTPTTIYRGVSYEYGAQPVLEYNYKIKEGTFLWNMGDGTVVQQKDLATVTHTYAYPGTYTLSFLYTDPDNDVLPMKATKKLVVVSPAVSIDIVEGKALQIKNTLSNPIDLSGWSIVLGDRTFLIPDMTIIAEKATATIPFVVFRISAVTSLALADPSGVIVARTGTISTTILKQQNTQQMQTTDQSIEATDLTVSADILEQSNTGKDAPFSKRTKSILFGGLGVVVLVLLIFLERSMKKSEESV